jgi:galactokinase
MTAPAERVATEFAEAFGGEPDGRWWAPGRVNLIGEHTDYNQGFVLPLALEQGVAAAARVADRPVLRVRSVQEPDTVEIPLAVVVDGDVPLGAGLSSSAALECAVAVAWNDLAGLKLSRDDLAAVTQSAENDVVGAPTGGMDQMASLFGRAGHLVFLDMRSLAVEPVPFDPPHAGLALVVVDTHAPHAHVDGEYAERRRSCETAARLLGVAALRDVSLDDLDGALARLGEGADANLLRKRVRHIVTENARVLDVVAMLRSGEDPRRIGPALTASHASMRDDFEITVPEVDTAVEAALAADAHGARMTGGGFGGCVLALVEADAVDATVRAVEEAYAAAGFRAPSAFVAEASDGAHRL